MKNVIIMDTTTLTPRRSRLRANTPPVLHINWSQTQERRTGLSSTFASTILSFNLSFWKVCNDKSLLTFKCTFSAQYPLEQLATVRSRNLGMLTGERAPSNGGLTNNWFRGWRGRGGAFSSTDRNTRVLQTKENTARNKKIYAMRKPGWVLPTVELAQPTYRTQPPLHPLCAWIRKTTRMVKTQIQAIRLSTTHIYFRFSCRQLFGPSTNQNHQQYW